MIDKQASIRIITHLDSTQPHAGKEVLNDGEFIELIKHYLLHPYIVMDALDHIRDTSELVDLSLWAKEDFFTTVRLLVERAGWTNDIILHILTVRTRKIIDHLISIADIDNISDYDFSDVEEITIINKATECKRWDDSVRILEEGVLAR